ncbi:MAG TPA: NAD(P)-dependent oxidoreductase [Chloroflexota bacterium]|nr:NAD(P)-dependent oxidoreductase [Chloroflexota bacterium]
MTDTERAADPKRVLVTGSTGAIGEPLCRYLVQRGHTVRGFARRPTPGLDDYVTGDLNDRDAVRRAVEGMDTIVHLGAYPNPADFIDVLLQPNVVGLYYVCEAAVEFGVKRLILASSVQVISGHRFRDRPVTVEDGPAPTNHYALTKVWAEAAGEMYARVHNLSVISVRIGWFPRNTGEAKRLAASPTGRDIFLSHRDSDRFLALCVESPNPPPGTSVILHASSRAVGIPRMDQELARRVIGYVPQDTWPEGLPFPVE